jgi:hypothetical protein
VLAQSLIDPDEYIEKTISLSFDVLQLSAKDVAAFIDAVPLPFVLEHQHKLMIVQALGTNPRRIKRFMNSLAFSVRIAQLAGRTFPLHGGEFDVVLKLLLLNYRYPAVASLLLADSSLIGRLAAISEDFQRGVADGDVAKGREARRLSLAAERESLGALSHDEDFWRLLAMKPPFPTERDHLARLQRWIRTTAVT